MMTCNHIIKFILIPRIFIKYSITKIIYVSNLFKNLCVKICETPKRMINLFAKINTYKIIFH